MDCWGSCQSRGWERNWVVSVQVVMESHRECQEAQKLLGMIKTAFPEVLTAIKTKQLAQEILLNKEEHIGEVAKTDLPAGFSPGLTLSTRRPSDTASKDCLCTFCKCSKILNYLENVLYHALASDTAEYVVGKRQGTQVRVSLPKNICVILAGLADDKEVDNMNDLVEQKLKKLHYFPPTFRVQAPHSIVAAHPLLAGIPKKAFHSEVQRESLIMTTAQASQDV
ncbi:MAG: hypothetical protein MMC33_004265 [Icmadophila ericetorum]|nr:hypothetical protein [Icmadophila ericetorum]